MKRLAPLLSIDALLLASSLFGPWTTAAAQTITPPFTLACPASGPCSLTGGGPGIPPPVTPPVTPPATPALAQVPLGVHLGSWLGGGAGLQGSISAHWAGVKTGFNRTPLILSAVLMNSYQDGNAAPAQWGGDVGTWTAANGLPMDGSTVPLLDLHMTNGTSTDSDYAGVLAKTYDAPLTAAMDRWHKSFPFKTVYERINWEFNTNFRGWGVPSAAQVPQWVAAWKHFANVLHTWGTANGVNVQMVWSPDTSYTQAEGSTFNLPVVQFFPAPDAAAVGGVYANVIGSDLYMGGYGVKSNFGQMNGTWQTSTTWSLGTFVAICQQYGCNIGVSETGDGPSFDKNLSAGDGTMAAFIAYLQSLATLTPAVPVAYVSVYDVSDGGATQATGGGAPAVLAGWKATIGGGGTLTGVPVH